MEKQVPPESSIVRLREAEQERGCREMDLQVAPAEQELHLSRGTKAPSHEMNYVLWI